jgi:hypothetical protein
LLDVLVLPVDCYFSINGLLLLKKPISKKSHSEVLT